MKSILKTNLYWISVKTCPAPSRTSCMSFGISEPSDRIYQIKWGVIIVQLNKLYAWEIAQVTINSFCNGLIVTHYLTVRIWMDNNFICVITRASEIVESIMICKSQQISRNSFRVFFSVNDNMRKTERSSTHSSITWKIPESKEIIVWAIWFAASFHLFF